MNVGGVHLLIGLVLLFLTSLLITLHVFVVLSPFYLISKWRETRKEGGEEHSLVRFFITNKERIIYGILLLFAIIFIFNFSVYIKHRINWMKDQNANFEAKEYYVVGQVVSGYRRSISSLLKHPDHYYILVPLNFWQKCIYDLGIKQLPEGDAEKAVWAEQWFVYFYSKRNQMARKPFRDRKIEEDHFESVDGTILIKEEALEGEVQLKPKENDYMDLVWFCLETLATKDFTDKRMYEERALQIYSGLAHHYAFMMAQGYAKLDFNSRRIFVKMPEMTTRNEKLVGWLNELPQKWRSSEFATAINKQYPMLESMRQMALILTLMDIVDARIWARQFDCRDPYIATLSVTRKLFVNGEEGKPSAHTLMRDKVASSQFHMVAINSDFARFINFVMEEKCDGSLPGEEKMSHWKRRATSPEDERKSTIRTLFHYELRMLDMEYVISEKYWTHMYDGTYQWQ